jgi:hypothetical protein
MPVWWHARKSTNSLLDLLNFLPRSQSIGFKSRPMSQKGNFLIHVYSMFLSTVITVKGPLAWMHVRLEQPINGKMVSWWLTRISAPAARIVSMPVPMAKDFIMKIEG